MEVRAREFFRRAATWPDLIRDVPELHHPTWHHRDFYWRQDQGRAIDLPDLQVHPEIIRESLERLHHFKKLLASRTVAARERAIGIAWVLHLVGDIHQPLHCSARVTAIERKGDHGGQDFELAASGRRRIRRESGIPCTPTGTTCSTGRSPAIGRATGRVPAAGRGPRRVPASAGAARGRAQAGAVRCLGAGIGRRRPERLSVEPPPRPGAVRRLSEPGHPGGPRSSGTGGLSAGADAPGRRGRRRTLTRLGGGRGFERALPGCDKVRRWASKNRLICRGAEGGTRTPTPLRAHDPESCASANSATSARAGLSSYGHGH